MGVGEVDFLNGLYQRLNRIWWKEHWLRTIHQRKLLSYCKYTVSAKVYFDFSFSRIWLTGKQTQSSPPVATFRPPSHLFGNWPLREALMRSLISRRSFYHTSSKTWGLGYLILTLIYYIFSEISAKWFDASSIRSHPKLL